MGFLKAFGATRRDITLSGNVSSTVYVYVPEILRDISKGDKFTLECSKKPTRLTSTVTGTAWESARDGDIPVLYRGKPVGFLSDYRVCRAVRKVLDAGLGVRVAAVCKAEGKRRGWPTILALTPSEEGIESQANKRLAELGMQPLPKGRTRTR